MRRDCCKPNLTTDEAGFTLLELLVAMTLLGFLITVLFGGLRFGARAWERAANHGSGTDQVRVAQMQIRRLLELAYPSFISDPLRPRVDFQGTEDQMTFLAPAPNALSIGGRARITLSRFVQTGTTSLLVEARPELAVRGSSGESDVLISGLTTLEFSYYGTAAPDAPAQWTDRWIDRTRLPLLVRIRGVFSEAGGRLWPELVVAPRLSADISCIYDVLTQYCRGR
jgi:general secretion pathway protein J